jgi:hypothetical protein
MRELGNKERRRLEQLECERQRKGEERTRQLERVWKQKEKERTEQLERDRGPPLSTRGFDRILPVHRYLVRGTERRERPYVISGEETPPDFPDFVSPLASANEKHRGGSSERRGRPSKSTQSNGSDEKEGLAPALHAQS